MLLWLNYNLLFENDAIFGGHVLIAILYWFTVLNLDKVQVFLIGWKVDNYLALLSVVWHDTLDYDHVTLLCWLELQVIKLHQVLGALTFDLESALRLVNDLHPHKLDQIWVRRALYAKVYAWESVRNFELILCEDVALTGLKWCKVDRILFGLKLALGS